MGEKNSPKRQLCKRKRDSNVDWLSLLPDHTIASILSRLPLKDAVRTSILSHRWENLWRHSLGNNIVLCHEGNRFDDSSYEFVQWVNRILVSFENQPVNEFVIRFRLDCSNSESASSWIKFALKKNVTRLHLDLNFNCVFPDVRKLSKLPSVSNNLKDVSLTDFLISGTLFQHFLSKCPRLERLCLHRIREQTVPFWKPELHKLINLNVSSKTLKYLKVIGCWSLKVVVSAPNLMSMNYDWGVKYKVEMESIPRLVELTIGFCTEAYVYEFARTFSYATQLTTLKLKFSKEMVERSISYPQDNIEFTVLKHLVIKMDVDDHPSLLWLICLIKAAPLLHKFKIKMRTWHKESHWSNKLQSRSGKNVWDEPPAYTWDEQKSKTGGHLCLKVLEFQGFCNLLNQWELVKHIVEIAENLEEMILDLDVSRTSWRANVYMRNAKATAERLVTPSTKLILRNSTQLPPSVAPFLLP